jgi:hypothetical protein
MLRFARLSLALLPEMATGTVETARGRIVAK